MAHKPDSAWQLLLHVPWTVRSPVMVHEHVDDVLEQVRLFGGEEATAQLLDDLPKLRNAVIVLLGVVSGWGWGESSLHPGKEFLAPPPGPAAAALPGAATGLWGPSLEASPLLCSAFHPAEQQSQGPKPSTLPPTHTTSTNPCVSFLNGWSPSLSQVHLPSGPRHVLGNLLKPTVQLSSSSPAPHPLDSCGPLSEAAREPSATWAQNPPQGQPHLFPSLRTSVQPPRPGSGCSGSEAINTRGRGARGHP